ncbi:MAG: crotonase/enoyl-CoA hydratase family protein [Xanthobacteraceae bacterium]
MPDSIEVSDDGGIRTIRMNRPEKKNALTQPMYAAMTRALGEAQDDDAIRCVVIAGGPGAFCAGADIAEFLESAQSGALRPHTVEFLKAIAHNKKPMVAAVRGLAVGIGVTMLFHCDHVVASTDATFTTPFLKLALIPEAASSLLAPLRMGYARAFSMLVMGRPLSAPDAKEAGIVNTIVESAAADGAALQAAREIAALPAGAVAVSRALLRGGLDAIDRQIDTEIMHFRERLQSDEARAAFTAFLSRKK